MSQVNIIQYAEIYTGSGPPLRIGSKVTPSTITLTGTGEIFHRVFNDVGPTQAIYSGDLTGLKWFAIKAVLETVVSFGDGTHNNSIVLAPNVWQIVNSGETTGYGATVVARGATAQTAITTVEAYNVADCDIEFIGAY